MAKSKSQQRREKVMEDAKKSETKPYRDTFGQKLTQQDVDRATRLILQYKKPTIMFLTRYLKFGVTKSKRILKVLEDAKVLTKNSAGEYTIVLKGEAQAVNAALRQLKKGKVAK